ncbi:uncharacterized protein SPSK_10035 [Sporothrix schenckii 1099-18]|uniref:Uncharacterized protein n=1 Tax=Sporothrix schenckii 1099-18 TaxID=1397361 RepID=A0A0F2M5Z0_SPOSC|nr:uncharacterized protein SPSK_10035 [Sporothrix schenckii 1099-18]KJR85047.1 hypothetical protein SPSK_10035 [Sporothrix schenckii 1099-18]
MCVAPFTPSGRITLDVACLGFLLQAMMRWIGWQAQAAGLLCGCEALSGAVPHTNLLASQSHGSELSGRGSTSLCCSLPVQFRIDRGRAKTIFSSGRSRILGVFRELRIWNKMSFCHKKIDKAPTTIHA